MLFGARRALWTWRRLIVSAEATGVAIECTEQAAAYAKARVQFGRPIATFQAVKHHCANMLVAPSWPRPRCGTRPGGRGGRRAALAHRGGGGRLALPAADECANLNIQVHGGIGFTWEHDAHLYLRRATAFAAVVDAEAAARDVVDLSGAGCAAARTDRPPARGRADPRRGACLRRAGAGADAEATARGA